MKVFSVLGLVLLMTLNAYASPAKVKYPSCQLDAQRAVAGKVGEGITDVRQAHISARANILQADIGTAHKAGELSQSQADILSKRVDRVRHDARDFVVKQGFLSAAERASYDRELDDVASQICPSATHAGAQ